MSHFTGNRAAQGYDRRAVSLATGYVEKSLGRTIQAMKEEADLMTIIRRFGVLGDPATGVRTPLYGDFTEVTDFRSALEAVAAAEASFAQLPSDFRASLDNDPERFVHWVNDPANMAKAAELGLVVLKTPPPPLGVPGTPPTTPATGS